MGIKEITTSVTGLAGVLPVTIYIDTDDTVATVTTSGYLNHIVEQQGQIFSNKQMALVYTTDSGCDWYQVTIAGANTSLVLNVSPGDVLLPVTVNRIAVFSNVAGQIADPLGTASHRGSLQAGISGTAGSLISFPGAANNGSLQLFATNSPGNFNTLITNAALGQTTTFTLPDPGAVAASFILTANAATQVITSGSLQVFNGNIIAGAVTPHAGTFISYPAATGGANDRFVIAAVTTGGNFTSTLSNGTQGQTTVFTLADPANAVAKVLVGATATPFTNGNLLSASGTGGLVADAGFAAANIQNKTNIIAQTTADIGGAGAGPITVASASLTAASVIVATIKSSSNAVAVAKCIAGAGNFDITFTGDPGAACVVNYVAFVVAQ